MSNEVATPNIADFIDGERDCKKGLPADSKRSEDYQRGYGFRYEMEQIQGANHGLKKAS